MSPVQGDHTCKNQRQPYQLYHESTLGFVGLYGVRINLLQFFQTLVHSQSIGQCSSSLNSSFIQFKTVEEIIPELVQALKINYYSCFMSKLLHQRERVWHNRQMNSYLKISDGLYVTIFKFYQQILPKCWFLSRVNSLLTIGDRLWWRMLAKVKSANLLSWDAYFCWVAYKRVPLITGLKSTDWIGLDSPQHQE